MPHYKNKELAQVGDVVKHSQTADETKITTVGMVTAIYPGAEMCNLSVTQAHQIIETGNRRTNTFLPFATTLTAGDCEKVV